MVLGWMSVAVIPFGAVKTLTTVVFSRKKSGPPGPRELTW